jgi:hypothetical protein
MSSEHVFAGFLQTDLALYTHHLLLFICFAHRRILHSPLAPCQIGSACANAGVYWKEQMASAFDIGRAGELLVVAWLANKGYSTNIDTKGPGSTDIEARGTTASLLVQVKTAILPSLPDALSAVELRNITTRAARLGCQAWEARVQLDARLRPVGAIAWRQLS